MSKAQRGLKPSGPSGTIGPATGRMSKEEAGSWSKERAADMDALTRLVCSTRGCHEVLAYVDVSTDATDGRTPGLRLTIMAPRLGHQEPSEPKVIARFVLTGSQDPAVAPVSTIIRSWAPGSRVVFVCRYGHESRFGAGEVTATMRRLARDTDVL